MKYADWPTKEQAAQQLGVSVKTLERLARSGEIQQKLRPRAGGTPQAVFNPADVQRAASERAAAMNRPFLMPPSADAPTASGGETLPALRETAATSASFVDQLAQAIATAQGGGLRLAEKPRVTMAEAIELGFTRENLRELVADGKLENVGTPHRYRFRRRDLDAL